MKIGNKPLDGIFTALLTPFDQNDRVNEKALERLVKFNLEMGVTGFYVGGTTAEAFMLSTEERKQVMDVVAATAPESTLIAHIGSLDVNEAVELGNHAKKLSYDVLSSVAPFYYKFHFNEIKNYYFHRQSSVCWCDYSIIKGEGCQYGAMENGFRASVSSTKSLFL